jgi:hypothetical protein
MALMVQRQAALRIMQAPTLTLLTLPNRAMLFGVLPHFKLIVQVATAEVVEVDLRAQSLTRTS